MIDNQKQKISTQRGAPASNGPANKIGPASYLRLAKANLRSGKQKEAFVLLQQAAVQFPDDPFVLSYFGCLQALVDKKYRSGVETCKRAITLLKGREEDDKEKLYALFYLNLGRAYLAAGKKQDAISAFTSGIKYDNHNNDLQQELHGIGKRKQPPVSFLDRSNPINKYIGMILHTGKKELEKGRSKRPR
jgi:tetratricopeptide (TPR) repeat protein